MKLRDRKPHDGYTEAPYTDAENDNRISEEIRLRGWALDGVRDYQSMDGMFTIGNRRLGLPELVMWGDEWITPILNAACKLMRKNDRAFREGELIDLGAVFPLRATKCFTRGTHDYGFQLILLPDIFGRYPDEDKFLSLIPVLEEWRDKRSPNWGSSLL
jgi:hypothetical protein